MAEVDQEQGASRDLSHTATAAPLASEQAGQQLRARCEFPGPAAGCGKCDDCQRDLRAREAGARGHEALIALQAHKSCRICRRIERYCQTDGQARGPHAFAPIMTCESCVHMGSRYHGTDDFPNHFCGQSGARRAAAFRSSGDFATDFMSEFRKFYDASPRQSAELCAFFAPRLLANEAAPAAHAAQVAVTDPGMQSKASEA